MRFATVLRGLLAAWLISLAVVPAAASARGGNSILHAMNSVRARNHLPALSANPALARAAEDHSSDMARSGVFSHGAFAARLSRYIRARAIGENLAWATECRAATIVRMWLHSAPHRHFLLTRGYRRAGVGISRSSHFCFVTADFASAN
jgi:uncharacterized protein YkwD